MTRMLKKAKLNIQQGASGVNMIKKFGGKFKMAFSKKKQSPAQTLNEHCDQDVHFETAALPDSFANETERLSTESRLYTEDMPDIAATHVDFDEKFRVSKNTSQDLAPSGFREPSIRPLELQSQDVRQETPPQRSEESVPSIPQHSRESSASGSSTPNSTDWLHTNRKRVFRAHSLPSSPSSPTTGASSDTFLNTPRYSDTSSSAPLIGFRQIPDEHKGASKECHQVLAEHLKGEEKEKESTEWASLVEWIKISHQAELTTLEKDHAAETEKLRQERSEVRRRLELRNRELRATKREMKDLKKSIDETTKEQEKIQPALSPETADDSDAESVDEDEGGVSLATNNVAPTMGAGDLRGMSSSGLKAADREQNHTEEAKKEAKKPTKVTAREEKERQRALKQQLLEESAPDFTEPEITAEAVQPAAIGEPISSTKQEAMTNATGYNRGPLTQFKELQAHNNALKTNLAFTRGTIEQLSSEAESAKRENARLRAENHFAQLEVGHCHAANACYRAELEDANPARTAHLDGLLKRKDEAYAELEERAADCAEQLSIEKKRRAVDNVYSEAEVQGLKKELAHRFNMIGALAEGKRILKAQNDKAFEMFREKIFQDDIIKAFLSDYDVIQNDNTRLIKMINERKSYVHDAEKQIAHLKAENIINDHAIHADKLKHRQTQQSLNGLTYINHQLTAKVDFQDEIREELKTELETKIKLQTDQINQLVQHGADDWLTRRHQAQEAQIAFLNTELTKLNNLANHWRIRALEQQDEFCPMFGFEEVTDFNAEETRWRLRQAERMVEQLQGTVRQLVREGKRPDRRVGQVGHDGSKRADGRVGELGHDGSKWLRDRAEAERVRERFRWVGV